MRTHNSLASTLFFGFTLLILLISLLFLVSCGLGTPPPCTVGLTLKPGESCRYVSSNDNFSFDFIFSVVEGGVGFPRLALKSPSNTFDESPWALNGGTLYVDRGDGLQISINQAVAQMCLEGKCFSASKNSDGSWTIKGIPLL